jgi:hypothetical protein
MAELCWVTQWEARGFDDWIDWADAHPEEFECSHAEHWAADSEDGRLGWDEPTARCRWDNAHAMCDLDKGHDGEHVFVPEREVVLMFTCCGNDPAAARGVEGA